ncbi:hypothetical protein [Rhabdaerophilum sp. SD176]|uniref:hypothetical protein n=1 Tax=Rhabdaerophilum sp. SD176 TaxID=2983548 RepID=UPI0024E03A54|nr:hypothetical protein [Rhabdaerophilum sp. SD176]
MRAAARRLLLLLATAPAFAVPVLAQQAPAPDPFVRPPPTQRPTPPAPPGQNPRLPGTPLPNQPVVTLDVLVRQGFEVKAIQRTSERSMDFVVLVQRSGELRTCLMRINRDQNRALRRDSLCF